MRDNANGKGFLLVRKFKPSGEFDGVASAENLWMASGINEIFKLIAGTGGAAWNAADSRIGIGDSAAAAADVQVDLQAAVNKTYIGMDATYPKAGASKSFVWRATFAAGDANYVWNEFVLKNAVSGIIVNRGVQNLGTKVAGAVWIATLTLSLA